MCLCGLQNMQAALRAHSDEGVAEIDSALQSMETFIHRGLSPPHLRPSTETLLITARFIVRFVEQSRTIASTIWVFSKI
jgi:hypothetical protein